MFYTIILQAVELICPANRKRSTDPGKSTAMVVWKDPSVMDTTGRDLEVMCMPPSGSAFPIGKTEVRCTVTNSKDEELACTFYVHICGTLEYRRFFSMI